MRSIRDFGLAVATLLLTVTPLWSAASAGELLADADDHFFNLEHDEAIRGYYAAMEASNPSANIWNRIATAILYQELHRLGLLDTSAFKSDDEFLRREKPKPDRGVKERFVGAAAEARRLAEARLSQAPSDTQSLFAMSHNYALVGNYAFMVDKAYISALQAGIRARRHSDRLREIDPEFVDAYLVAGAQEYVVGGLPWALRAVVALGGIRGNKDKGREWVEYVAEKGELLNVEARMLLALLYRREHRPMESAQLLEGLVQQFPRNYVLRLELASMYLDANETQRGLDNLLTAERMVRTNEHRYARMPEKLRHALKRKIVAVREDL